MAKVAGNSLSPPPRLIGKSNYTAVIFLRRLTIFAGTRFPSLTSGNTHRHNHLVASAFSDRQLLRSLVSSEAPSCLLVGPIETANQETLEALYRQARDAYYSGTPLIVDDMFDRVELKLRWYGSKYVVKYPRCSLLRQSTYADAQEDPSQKFALASIWCLILLFGSSVCLLPMLYSVGVAYQEAFNSETFYNSQSSMKEPLGMLNSVLFMLMGSVIGLPIASASARALQGLWQNDLVALKGACPNCGEEVFAFVSSYKSSNSPHRADCHVCESLLEFRTKAEKSILKLNRGWVHGRVYLISKRQNRRK